MSISIVIPLYNEQDSLQELTDNIVQALSPIEKEYELLFIDDGSSDNSCQVLREIKKTTPQVKIIRLRKNFGKSAALAEGFKKAKGKLVFTMDADMQDDPAEIPKMIKKLEEGYDLVSGWKKKRNDPLNKTIPSKFFNLITRILTGIKIHDFNCGFKLYKNEVIKTIPVYGELHRYLPVLAHWQGFKVGEIDVRHHARKHGKSKFGTRRLFNGFFDLLTVLFITRYRHKPLHLFGFIGLLFIFLGILISLYLTIQWFQGLGIGQRPLLFLGILLLIVGVQSFSLGLIGGMLTSQRENSFTNAVKEIDE
ncbi:MAG: glycosyltransferase family 2 protein [Calditrichaceae bacterium]|nr:glycosyltransferase family 2 protein [Calditrichaceae bacterium]RQV93910.1 MAG: glycosyltransferase [Calditrichota bacterium]